MNLFILITICLTQLVSAYSTYRKLSDNSCKSGYCTGCDDTGNTCTSCLPGYILKGGDCIWKTDLHCTDVQYSSSECEECEEGYVLTFDNDCIICENVKNCTKLNGNACDSGCLECSTGTYYHSTKEECVNDDPYCAKYDDNGYCTYCNYLYYLDDNNNCKEGNIDHCLEYKNETYCSYCGEERYSGNCELKTICEVENCARCSGSKVYCGECEDGYQGIVNEDLNKIITCFKCDVEHCKSCVDNESDQCDTCENGYYKTGSICTKSTEVDHCLTYSTTEDECSDCEDGCYFTSNKCTELTIVDHCSRYSTTEDKCNYCENGYTISDNDNTCLECPTGCYNCWSSDVSKCSYCFSGYFYTSSEYNCTQCSDHCNECSDENTCSLCEDGYGVIDGKCEQCIVSNCLTCDGNENRCELCESGYFMNNDFTCEKCGDECYRSLVDSYEICTNTAYECYVDIEDSLCKILDEDGETCLGCYEAEEYTLDNGECISYGSLVDANGDVYGCFKHNDFENIELYEPVNGKCENPFLSGAIGVMVVSTLLITFLLI